MFWTRAAIRTAARATATGAAVTFLSTTFSCGMAIVVEGTANRVLYHFFPHWYRDVKYAYGLDLHLNHDRLQLVEKDHCVLDEMITEQTEKAIRTEGGQNEVLWTDQGMGERNDIFTRAGFGTGGGNSGNDTSPIAAATSATATTTTKGARDNREKIAATSEIFDKGGKIAKDVFDCALTG